MSAKFCKLKFLSTAKLLCVPIEYTKWRIRIGKMSKIFLDKDNIAKTEWNGIHELKKFSSKMILTNNMS